MIFLLQEELDIEFARWLNRVDIWWEEWGQNQSSWSPSYESWSGYSDILLAESYNEPINWLLIIVSYNYKSRMIVEVLKKTRQGHLCPVFVESFQESCLVKVTFGKINWDIIDKLCQQGISMTGRCSWWRRRRAHNALNSAISACRPEFSVVVEGVVRMSCFSLYFNANFLIVVWGTKINPFAQGNQKSQGESSCANWSSLPCSQGPCLFTGNGHQRSVVTGTIGTCCCLGCPAFQSWKAPWASHLVEAWMTTCSVG